MKRKTTKNKTPETLNDLSIGQSAVVSHMSCDGPMKRHLIEMGVTPGVRITLKKYAPMGDPIELKLRGYTLSIRRSEAENIYIESDSLTYDKR